MSEQAAPKKYASGRGLAAASPETRLRVSRLGGMTLSRDQEHMKKIGRNGGKRSWSGVRRKRAKAPTQP